MSVREGMKIRKATRRDIPEIARLMLGEFSKPPFKQRARLSGVVKSLRFYFKLGKVFVAVSHKNIVGVVVFKVEQWWEGVMILVEDLAVEKGFKNQGIGKLLMDKVEHYARKIEAKAVSFVTHKKSPAVKFYAKQGYKVEKHTLCMRKEIA